MFRPVPMTRVLIVGSRDELPATVDALHRLKILHIVDHEAGAHDLGIGAPLPQASQLSEHLLKLRSIATVLRVEEDPRREAVGRVPEDVQGHIRALELNIAEDDQNRKRIEGLLDELTRKAEALGPLAELPLSLDDYHGYDNLEVLVGRVPEDLPPLETVTRVYEAFRAEGVLAVFVPKAQAPAMRTFLGQHGFSSLSVPAGTGRPRDMLQGVRADQERWTRRQAEIDERLHVLRERQAAFILAAKARLETEIEKAEAPLRFATTEHTFVAEGWVPHDAVARLRAELGQVSAVSIEELEHGSADEEDDQSVEPPVLLRRTKPMKPLEMLVRLFGLPSYHEADPTFVVVLSFGLMFGLIMGDAGYGLVWLAYGAYMLHRWKNRRWDFWKNLVAILMWGGFWSFIFGTFLFAEAFGIPFHAPPIANIKPEEAFNWSDNILRVSIPIYPVMEKLHQVTDFMVLSIVIAYIHLGVGLIFGVFDEWRLSKSHSLGKIGWFAILTSFYAIIMARAARWPGFASTVWNGPMFWFPKQGLVLANLGFTATNPIPYLALGLLVGGIVILAFTERENLMEVISLLTNVISYARIAGIGVAEEAVIFAFNSIALKFMIFPWAQGEGSPLLLIAGLATMAGANVLVFLLATISSTIQSIRLNWVEFFLKFYKGTGRAFQPFGEKIVPEV